MSWAPTCSPAESAAPFAEETSRRLGYTEADVTEAPEGSNLGLGCGNPQVIAALKPGETVLDLGSGGGFDCFLAAKQAAFLPRGGNRDNKGVVGNAAGFPLGRICRGVA